MSAPALDTLLRPRFRGVIHTWAAVGALVSGVALVALSRTPRAAAASGVFALCLVVLFSVSAIYHRVTWSVPARALMRRLDHAAIYLLIAGTYTSIALLALPPATADKLIVAAWIAALIGIIQSILWIRAPKWLVAVLAVTAGWTVVPWLGEVGHALPLSTLVAIFGGGAFYTTGALVYAVKLRTPSPEVFGYHEIFHALTVGGAACHFAALFQLVR